MPFIKNLKDVIAFKLLKIKVDKLLALEDASDIIYAVDNFVDEKKAKETLKSLTSISVAKGYCHLYGFNHIGCACWRCHLRNECLQILMRRGTNKVVLTTSYKVLRIKEDNTHPFYE